MNSVNLPSDCSKQWELLLLLLSSEEKKIDKTSENEIEMMNYFYNNTGVRKILHQWLLQMRDSYAVTGETDTAMKCDNIALYWRQHGNTKFRNNDMNGSYFCYTKSVLFAKRDGEMYPLALANRSATLLRLKRYVQCLSDIKLALEAGYPNEQRHKLFLREADCCIELGNLNKSKECIEKAVVHVNSLKLSLTNKSEFQKNIQLLEKKINLFKNEKYEPCEEEHLPDLHLGESTKFVSASNALELRYSDTTGRHVIANSSLQRGDVVFSEEPYAFVALPLDSTFMALVCESCCKSDINFVPCSMCSRSIYCSEECRKRGWDAFHRWECVGAQSRVWPTIGIAHLALRILMITTHKGFPSLDPNVNKPVTVSEVYKSYLQYNNVDVYQPHMPAFLRVFYLVTNFDKMNNTDYIQYALTAVMLTIYLESFTSYFDYLKSRLPFTMSNKEACLLVATLLLRHMGQLVCNGHAVMSLHDVSEGGARTISEREVRLATAIFPSASMMNHSCDPNIINSFYHSRLIVRCSRELQPGSELLNCYGPSRTREPAADRRAQLKAQYLFNCECSACVDPERRNFVLMFTAYACPNCKGPVVAGRGRRPVCQQCRGMELDLQRIGATLEKAAELVKQSDNASSQEERCEKLLSALKLRQQVLHRHHTILRDTADRLACFYAEMGDFNKSIEFIKQNIPSLEYQFGSFSVEVAHELRKLAGVMLERIISSPQHPDFRNWCLETHKIIKKAMQLFELNYGSWEPLVKILKGQEQYVAGLLADSRGADDSVHNMLHYNLKI